MVESGVIIMRKRECLNPIDSLIIIKQRHDARKCGNCIIPQILRTPCLSYQATARLKAALKKGMEIKPNPEYPESSDYPTIAVCPGDRAIAISTK